MLVCYHLPGEPEWWGFPPHDCLEHKVLDHTKENYFDSLKCVNYSCKWQFTNWLFLSNNHFIFLNVKKWLPADSQVTKMEKSSKSSHLKSIHLCAFLEKKANIPIINIFSIWLLVVNRYNLKQPMCLMHAVLLFVCVGSYEYLLIPSSIKTVHYDLSEESLPWTLKTFRSLLFGLTRGHRRILTVSLSEYLFVLPFLWQKPPPEPCLHSTGNNP